MSCVSRWRAVDRSWRPASAAFRRSPIRPFVGWWPRAAIAELATAIEEVMASRPSAEAVLAWSDQRNIRCEESCATARRATPGGDPGPECWGGVGCGRQAVCR